MALKATNVYVTVTEGDPEFKMLLETFYGKSDVVAEEKEIFDYLRTAYTGISGRFVVGSYACNTWWSGSPSALTAWSDSEGWGRHLLGNFILSRGLLNHLYYDITTEIRAALATPDTLLRYKLTLVDVPVTDSTPFKYKVSREEARKLARTLPGDENHLVDLIFCIGNYLGQLPSRAQVVGETALPIAAVLKTQSAIQTPTEILSNEQKLAVMNMVAKTKMADPVAGVRFRLESGKIDGVCRILFEPGHLKLCSELPAVRNCILSQLEQLGGSTSTFEDRVETMSVVAERVKDKLVGLLLFKKQEDLNVLLSKLSIEAGEMIRGDSVVIQPRYVDNKIGRTLLRVGSPFSPEAYSLLTARLVQALLVMNKHVEFNYVEAILVLLQRYIHYRTNALRFVNLPVRLEILHKFKTYVIDFSDVDRVFASLQNSFPEVERAWCAPLATVAYFLLKDTGGSYAKWRDMVDIPTNLNFDFVGYLDPRVISGGEATHLSRIMNRFQTYSTPVRGFKLDGRMRNPMDTIYEEVGLTKEQKRLHRNLLSN